MKSRGFVGDPWRDDFRRTFCNLLRIDMAGREIPSNYGLVGGNVRSLCCAIVREAFGLEPAMEFARRT